MRQDFVLVRGPGIQERYPTLPALAERLHALRGERPLHLRLNTLGHVDGEEGPCVQVKAGDEAEAVIGYALMPETLAYQGAAARDHLVKALLDQKPDLHRQSDGERVAFEQRDAA
jgi:hypothetical protein